LEVRLKPNHDNNIKKLNIDRLKIVIIGIPAGVVLVIVAALVDKGDRSDMVIIIIAFNIRFSTFKTGSSYIWNINICSRNSSYI
jgi:hypothetical protein